METETGRNSRTTAAGTDGNSFNGICPFRSEEFLGRSSVLVGHVARRRALHAGRRAALQTAAGFRVHHTGRWQLAGPALEADL